MPKIKKKIETDKSKKKEMIDKLSEEEKNENRENLDKDLLINEDNNEIDENVKSADTNIRKKQNKQVMLAVILMLAVLLIIITVPFIMSNYVNKFWYIDLNFQKTKLGKITFYSVKIPLTDKQMKIIADYNLNLRNNPKKLEYIKVNISENEVIFKKSKTVYISLQSDSPKCEDNMIAVVGLTAFLNDFGNLEVRGAMDEKEYANETGFPYVTCKNNPDNTIIHLISGNETKIDKINDNCYELSYKNCEINQVAERFILIILEKYMDYFEIK